MAQGWIGRTALGLVASAGLVTAADAPRWPLDGPLVLTSSFGEYRASHVHAGIDFGTGGKIGAPCRSVGDGSVVRMRMSPYGYGKALYILLDDGRLVVYAHLSRFASPMAERARAEQKRLGHYTFDIELPRGEMRVLRGEVIAWSGDTGVGVPHLHFEMRQGDVAINPQTQGFAVPDTMRPVIADIFVSPMDAASHVAGGMETRALGSAPLVAGGKLGFSVRAWDHAASREHRQAPYRMELRVDGRALYRSVLERADYADNHLQNLEYDQERLVEKEERVQLLYKRTGNRFPGREAPEGGEGWLVQGNGPERFAPGPHDIEVEVADVGGRTTVRRARVVLSAAPVVELETGGTVIRAADADLTAGVTADTLRIAVEWSKDGERWQAAPAHPLALESIDRVWQAEVPGAPRYVRATVRDASGLAATRWWDAQAPATPPAGLRYDVKPAWRARWIDLDIRAAGTARGLEPVLVGERPIALAPEGLGRWSAVVDVAALARPLELRVGSETVQSIDLATRVVRRGEPARIADLDSSVVVELESGALLEDIALRIVRRKTAGLGLGPELRPAGPCIRIEPRSAALDKPARLLVEARNPRAGLFWVNRSGDLRFLSADRNRDGWLEVTTRFFSDFVVLADTTKPKLGSLQVTPRGTRPERLRFLAYDEGAGLGDGGVRVTLDGATAIPEWDPETGGVVVEPDAKLAKGAHTLKVQVTDRLGNRIDRTLSFRIP